MPDAPDRVEDVFLARAQRVALVADGGGDLVGDIADEAVALAVQRRAHRAAARVPQHDHKRAAEVRRGILDAAELVVVEHVARHADHEQLAQDGVKNLLRDHARVRAGDHDRPGVLAVDGRLLAQGGVGALAVTAVARKEVLDPLVGFHLLCSPLFVFVFFLFLLYHALLPLGRHAASPGTRKMAVYSMRKLW